MAPPSYKDLIARLPRTFGPSLNDQFRQWDLLFPAEQRALQAQLDWLSALPAEQFTQLFAPLLAVENRMDLPRWQPGAAGLSIHDVGVLARSPLYPQWRSEVEKIFARIDDAVASANPLQHIPRLVLCILPAGLPLSSQPLWPELSKQGTWIPLGQPFSKLQPQLLAALASRKLPPTLQPDESTWFVECDFRGESTGTVLCWTALAAIRREFLNRLNTISRDLKSADQATDDLRRADIARLLGPPLASQPRVREFLRSVFLTGNGSLVFNNSFVQWASSEALRRVQPQVLIAGFGVRPKLKPFSSMVLFEDQTRSNPTPDEDDPAGSLIDALLLSQYVYLSAQRLPAYQSRSITLFAAAGLDKVLLLAPPTSKQDFSNLVPSVLSWLESRDAPAKPDAQKAGDGKGAEHRDLEPHAVRQVGQVEHQRPRE